MFSVLIQEPNGNERLREDALEVRRLHSPVSREGKVVVDPGVVIRWSDGIETHFGEAEDKTKSTFIYVMNRHGSTVAQYSL